jgi:hypothetical protein
MASSFIRGLGRGFYIRPFVLSLSKDRRERGIQFVGAGHARETSFKFKIKTAGGSPAASHFFLLRQRKSNQKEGDPGLPPLRGTLRCSAGQAAAELALRAQTVLADTS